MMVAAIIVLREFALRVVGPAEFAAPDHERVVEQAALFEVGDERVAGLVHVLGLATNAVRQIAVMVPARMIKLDKTHVALGHAPREQTIRGKSAGTLRVVAVEREGA